jgi:hypothetical protein
MRRKEEEKQKTIKQNGNGCATTQSQIDPNTVPVKQSEGF